jgi:hypothetical protein
VEAFDHKWEAFKITTRFFKTILREIEAFSKITRLFEEIFNGIEVFFKLRLGIFKESEPFLNYFQKNWGFFHKCRTF